MKNNKTISVMIPCYNEEEALPETARQLSAFMDELVNERDNP